MNRPSQPQPWRPDATLGARLARLVGALGLASAMGLWTPTAQANRPSPPTEAAPKAAAKATPKAAPKAASAQQHASGAHRKNANAAAARTTYADHPGARAWAMALAASEGLDLHWIEAQLAQAQRLDSVRRLILPAPTPAAKNWAAYRARFVEPVRIQAGLQFWKQHADTLARAQATYGVPAELIVGIIGVETLYGRHTGQFRVLDALATLAFDFPTEHPRAQARTAYFQGELAQLLLMSRREQVPPTQWRGSYAGAMGLPQFMPTSIEKFAVDFDGDGHRDLAGSAADAIGSVAHYLKAYGWQTGMPTHFPVAFDAARLDLPALMAPDILPSFGVAAFEARGAVLDERGRAHTGLLALIELLNGDPAQGGAPPSYVAGTENFYVVTRYNWSSYYAMAVIDLGEAVATALRSAP